MIVNRAFFTALPLCAGILVLACNNPSSGEAPATSASTTSSATPLSSAMPVTSAAPVERKHHPRFRGPGAMLFHQAHDLTDLTDTQKDSLAKIAESVKEDPGPKPEFKDFQTELMTEVKAGKIESTKLSPKIDAIDKAMAAKHDREADNLNQLHTLLTADQRKTLTANVRAKEGKMEDFYTKMRDMGSATPTKPEDRAKRRVDRLTKELDLDATQVPKVTDIATKLASAKNVNPDDMRDQWKKHTEALLGDFEKDTFDAKKSDLYSNASKKGHASLQNEVDFYSQVVPLLKPEQRDKLAARLEHPMMGREGHGRMGGGGGGEDSTGFERHWRGPYQPEEDGPGGMMPGMPGPGMQPPPGMTPPATPPATTAKP